MEFVHKFENFSSEKDKKGNKGDKSHKNRLGQPKVDW